MKNAARLLACLACILLCGCAAVSFDGAVKRGVLSSESELKSIEIVRQGSPITVRRHLSLEQGDRVSTDSESTAIIRYANGTVVYVRPNSVVRIGSIFVEFGEIFVRAKGFFRVDTEFVTAGVEGTEYVVRVGPQQQTGVIVLEGRVGCESKLKRWPKFSLGPLEKARFEREGPPDRSRAEEAEIQEIRRWVNEIDRILAPPIPQFELPKRGYCCTDKSLFPNETAVSCQRKSGRFYDDFEVARRECSRVSPAAGFCCVDARLSESSEQDCQIAAAATSTPTMPGATIASRRIPLGTAALRERCRLARKKIARPTTEASRLTARVWRSNAANLTRTRGLKTRFTFRLRSPSSSDTGDRLNTGHDKPSPIDLFKRRTRCKPRTLRLIAFCSPLMEKKPAS
jgi:hypothetical protein